MKNVFLSLTLLCAVLVIVIASSCTEKESCQDPKLCAKVPDNRIPDQLIIELKNFYTKDDITGPRDSFTICPAGETSMRFDFSDVVDVEGCSDACYTGKEVFLKDLNNVVYGKDSPSFIDDFILIDTCKCAEEIILIQLIGDLPDVNIYNGVAAGTSKTKEENNGTIGAIGYNYDLKDIAKLNDPTLIAERGPAPDTCGVFINPKLDPKDPGRYAQQENDPDPRPEPSTICTPVRLNPGKGMDEAKNKNIVRVAVIDTGVDPYYNYRSKSGGGMPNQADAFTFTEEVSFFQQGMNQVSTAYGAPIMGNAADLNGNCLNADYYGYDYKNADNNPADRKGHGTHIAHTILTANDVQGEIVRVMPLQFGDYQDRVMPLDSAFNCDLFAAICAINYAVKNKADIINMSWGYFAPETNWVLKEQLIKARTWPNNILMIASAGNDHRSVDKCLHWPSDFSTDHTLGNFLISVAALDSFSPPDASGNIPDLKLAEYSNFGNKVDLAAPGTNIVSALVHSGFGTVPLSGTSMAAAVISRRASILMGGNNVSKLRGDQVKKMILSETIPYKDACIGKGRFYDPKVDPDLRAAIGYKP
jgi:hypothetical protein